MPRRDEVVNLGGHVSLGMRGVLGMLVGLFAVGLGIVRRDAAAVGFGLAVLGSFIALGALIATLDRAILRAENSGDSGDSPSSGNGERGSHGA